WDSEAVKIIRSELPPQALAAIREAEQKSGFVMGDFDRLAFTLDMEKQELVASLSLRKPFDPKKWLDQMQAQGGQQAEQRAAGGKTYYLIKGGGNNPFGNPAQPAQPFAMDAVAFCFFGDQLIVAGSESAVSRLLKEGPPRNRTGALALAVNK